jgi:putative membrane protein
MMHWYYAGFGWGGWVVMTLSMVAFWALVVYAVVALTRGDRQPDAPKDPLRILDERFARGEIDEEEYHRHRDTLQASAR